MTKIKICGLTRFEDINAVNSAKPDYIGFVFAESKRQVDIETAKRLKSALNQEIKAVGVFVNQPIEEIISLANARIIDIIQLHGDEDEEYISNLREEVSLPIIKAMRIRQKSDVKKTKSDFALFDTYDKNQYGGSGVSFNWELLQGYEGDFFLAGGLQSDNIEEAIKTVKPFCVDISSGVETNGIKDQRKILEIVEKVRRINYE
ncbi:phosphoribosylanthranilate isomerase [Acetobacterium sp.]|uniref:phosphoribosylanthranilate isomerase n=1 Tax=Acetobacterium sp. TaxID=1872094 RepID=UPI002F3F9DD1